MTVTYLKSWSGSLCIDEDIDSVSGGECHGHPLDDHSVAMIRLIETVGMCISSMSRMCRVMS